MEEGSSFGSSVLNPVISRRRFIRVGLCGTAVLFLPAGCHDSADEISRPEPGRFFDPHPFETVRALAGLVIPEGLPEDLPEDQNPGAVTARVADYMDCLLGAFTVDPPRIYAAGPYSGRHGGENGFEVYLPLSRVKEIAWRNTIEGSQGIAEREFNGPVRGLQEIYSEGIEALDAQARGRYGSDFKTLEAEHQSQLCSKADQEFRAVVFDHTVEGMYAAPEYGGNADCAGWGYILYEGDRQPVGYTRKQVEEPDGKSADKILSAEEVEEAAKRLREILVRRGARSLRGLTGGGR